MSELDPLPVDVENNILHAESTDINRSLSNLTVEETSLDHVLRKCGDFGRFQMKHYFLMNCITMSAGIIYFYYVFAAAEPDHRCRLPENIWPNDTQYFPINRTHQEYLNNYIPKTKDEQIWEKCVRYTSEGNNQSLTNCSNGWVYDRSIYGYTFTEEANFVCRNESQKSWLATFMQCGAFSLLIIGSLADKYGRKRVTVIVTVLLFFVCLLTQILMQWIPMTVKTRFIILLINQFASGLVVATYSLVFILMLELTSVARTGFVGNLAFISFTIGEVIITLFAYLTRDWQKLKWANTAFIGLGIPYLYFMPESPLYMYAKGQYAELEILLRRIARENNREEAEWYSIYQELIHRQPKKFIQMTFRHKSYQLFSHRTTILRLIIAILIGFTTLMLYVKISYGLAILNISPYLWIVIGAIVEAASYVTSSILISTRLGRKGSFLLMMSLTILCTFLIPIMTKYSSLATLFIAQFGKYTISGATAISWIFVPELFPTSIRSTANGFFIAFGRVGAILAPIINTSISKPYLPYTFYLSSILATLVLLSSLILPETKDKPMDDVKIIDI